MIPSSWHRLKPSFGLVFGILAFVTLVRLIGLYFSKVDLFFDESQYWAWSRELAFGYVTKPPLLAWAIFAASNFCGNSEACIRAPCPLFYLAMALNVYAIAAELYGPRVAFFAALLLGITTGTAFSSRIVSTDVPLLFFWSLALLAYVKLRSHNAEWWTVVLGLSIGMGLLAKYAMIYFLLGISVAAWIDDETRLLLRTRAFWFAVAIAVLLVSPNLEWNIAHNFSTFREVENNAAGDGVTFNWRKGIEFSASQFGVFGPVLFTALLIVAARMRSGENYYADRLMMAFAVPQLALIAVLAFLTHANPNWAATSFISGGIAAAAFLVRRASWKWVTTSIAIGIVAQALLVIGDYFAPDIHLPFIANGDIYSRTLGWRSFAEQTGNLARRIGAPTIVSDWHAETASLLYYWRDQPEKIVAWPNEPIAADNFELMHPLTATADQPFLYVTACPRPVALDDYFSKVVSLGYITAWSGPHSPNSYKVFELADPRGPIPPRGACTD
jgi:4-amino-4-deoxy-L-arabinose transferase-like glycosyltransferase